MNFDISRLRRSDRIVGVSAIAFFIFLFFFKWYGVSSNIGSVGGLNVNASYSGWHTFTNSRWIWLLTIVVALGAVAVAAGVLKIQSPVQAGVLVAGLGALSTLLIFYRIVHHPSANVGFGTFHASVGIKIGIWLGLIAAAALTYGGYMSMQDEGTSLADVREQASSTISNFNAGQSDTPTSATTTTTATPIPSPPAATAPERTPPDTPPAF